MTVIKRSRVPNTITEAIQEQFNRMDNDGYSTSIKWRKSESVSYSSVFRDLSDESEPVIYTW